MSGQWLSEALWGCVSDIEARVEEKEVSLLTDTDLEVLLSYDIQEPDESRIVISPFSESSLTPIGYDLRVGGKYVTSDSRDARKDLKEGEAITLRSGKTALITTLEYLRMPTDRSISGLIESKVSQVSKGLSHISTTIDPDWQGELLIAVHNHASDSVTLKFGDPFCTIVFIENTTPSTRKCEKVPGRIDVLLNQFQDRSEKSSRDRRRRDLIQPAIVIFSAIGGFLTFGNAPGFAATVAAGVAVSQFVERRYLR